MRENTRNRKCNIILLGFAILYLFSSIIGSSVVHAEEETQTIIVGTNAEYSPFEYLDSSGNITGFDYDLMEAIADAVGVELEWKDMAFDSLIGSMEAGDIEVIAAAIGPTEERAQSVDFSDIYYTGSQSIIYREGMEYTTFADLKGATIAVLEGSQSDLIASGETTDYGIVEDAEVVRFKSASYAVQELKNGGADAVIIDTIMAQIYCEETDGIAYSEVEGTEEDTVFCIEKGNEELVELINEGLAIVMENGTYDELYTTYFGGEEDSDSSAVVEEETADDDSSAAVEEETETDDDGFLATLKFIFLEENRWMYYVRGLGVTIFVALLSVLLGIAIGLVVALVRLSADRKGKKTVGSRIAGVYVDIIRGTPSVLQLMIIYFVIFHSSFGYAAAIVSFGINSGAYVSEVIRGGIRSVDKGQSEAGRSLGLSYGSTMRYIIIPQAVKNILPALGNEFIQLIKETSILGYVGIMDLTKASSYVSSRTYKMFIPLITAGILYYVIVKVLSVLLLKFERRLQESD